MGKKRGLRPGALLGSVAGFVLGMILTRRNEENNRAGLSERIARQQREIAEQRLAMDSLRKDVASLEERAAALDSERNALQGLVDTQAAELAQMRDAYETATARLTELEADAEQAQAIVDAFEEEETQEAHAEADSNPRDEVDPDDLRRIEGVGPKIAAVLGDAGIMTYAQMAAHSAESLRAILDEAGIGRIADPTTWPRQAELAAAGEWDALKAYQDTLKGGRATE